jgi:hypothetical protein
VLKIHVTTNVLVVMLAQVQIATALVGHANNKLYLLKKGAVLQPFFYLKSLGASKTHGCVPQ